MGSNKRQTRIVAQIGGKLRKLASVRELSDGRLIITVPARVLMWSGLSTEEKRVAIQQKYTVHHSVRSKDGGNLIHHTITLEDGGTVEVHCYTHAFRDFLFQPICGHIMSRTDDDWNVEPRDGDRVVNVGGIDQTKGTLGFVLCLSENPQPVILYDTPTFQTVRVPFRRFQLDVTVSASRVPSFHQGFIGHMATSTPIVPFGPAVEELPRVPQPGFSREKLQRWMPEAITDLINLHGRHAIAACPDPRIEEMLRHLMGLGAISLPRIEKLHQAMSKFLDGLGTVLPSD